MLRDVGAAPIWIHLFSGNNELWAGALDEAEAMYRAGAALHPDNPTPWMCLAFVHARRGDVAQARRDEARCVARFPQTSAYQRAMLAGAARDKPGVLARLRDARSLHDPLLMSACVDPSFEWLATDRDFNRLLRDWGLPGWSGPSAPVAPDASTGAPG
jgi:hypothetical protein